VRAARRAGSVLAFKVNESCKKMPEKIKHDIGPDDLFYRKVLNQQTFINAIVQRIDTHR
jgi:hypothetical protein